MNDFTKEELEEIAEMMRHARKQGIETTHNLPCKVEAKSWKMIENYCEHDWRKGVHLFNDIYCTKCKQHFEVNNEA